MAITGTDRGTGTHNTSALSFTLSPGSNFAAANSWAVLVVAVDNADTSGTAHSTFTVTDTLGNTWTRRISPLHDPGAASAGVEGAIFTCPQDKGRLTTGVTLTVTFDANTTAKAWTLMEVTPSVGFQLGFVTGNVNTGAATTTPTVTTSSITIGNMVIGGLFNEQGTGQTVTEDGDSTNGAWSTQQTAEVGTTGTGMSVSSQRKVVTSSATQTFNPTLGTSSNVILGWIELTETIVPARASLASTQSGFARSLRSISDGFIGPNLLLGTLGLAAAMAAAPVLRGASTVATVQRTVADPFDSPNLLLSSLAPVATKPFVVSDPGGGGQRVRVTLPDNAPANIMLLAPAQAGEAPFVSRAAEYQPRPRVTEPQAPPNVLLSTLQLAADMAAAPMLRGASTVTTVARPTNDEFDAPNLLLLAVVVPPDPLPIGLQDQFDYRPVPRVISGGSTHGQPLTLGIPAVAADPLPIGLQDVFDSRPVPKVVSSGSSHSQPLTLGIPAGAATAPFRSTSFEERPRTRRVVAPDNQGSLLGLYGITGWGPVIQEITDGRARRPITRIEFEQPPNLLVTVLAIPPQAIPIGKQWYAHRPIARPVAADIPPNILLTTLAQQPQALPVGTQDQWFDYRPVRGVVSIGSTQSHPLTLVLPAPTPFVVQWFDYRPIGRPIPASIPPNLLLSTLAPRPFPVSIHNAHWEFERKYKYPASVGSADGPLLTLAPPGAPIGYLVGTVRVLTALDSEIRVTVALTDDVRVVPALDGSPRTRPEE